MLYRNYPRDRRYQFFSHDAAARRQLLHLPIERARRASTDLPTGGHLVVAPYVEREPDGDGRQAIPARRSRPNRLKPRAGVDVKWTPNADDALDATVNPDFSQIESDAAQISANERFALFFPEKRPFFLEGVELLLDADPGGLHAHASPSPRWGARATGKHGEHRATRRSSPTTPAAAA